MAIIQTVIKGGGTTPTGTLQITTNGTHDVTNYATADVQVPTTAPTYYRELSVDNNGVLQANSKGTSVINLTGVTGIGDSALSNAYYQNTNLTTLPDFSNITSIGTNGLAHAFGYCFNLTGVLDLSALTTVGSYGLQGAFSSTGITKVILSNNLTTIGSGGFNQAFRGGGSLTEAVIPDLMMFNSSNAMQIFSDLRTLTETNPTRPMRDPDSLLSNNPLTTCPYERLEYVQNQGGFLCNGMRFQTANMYNWEMSMSGCPSMFSFVNTLESIYFPVLTRWSSTGASSFLQGCTNANFTRVDFPMLQVFKNNCPFTSNSFPSQVTVHFRMDQQTFLSGQSAYPFGAAACAFDLVGTIEVNGVNYLRQGKQNITGYYAWQKATSNITVGGVVYTFDISAMSRNTNPVSLGPIIYGWVNGSTKVYTDTLDPQVGDYIYPDYSQAKSTTQSITAVDNEFVYTADSAEPAVSDTVYSDAGVTSVGTITSIS